MPTNTLHLALNEGAHIVAKEVTMQTVDAAVPGALGSTGGAFAALNGVGGIVLVALSGALSAGLAQLEYRFRRNELTDIYREELSARLHKDPKAVSDRDLDTLAKGDKSSGIDKNRTIRDALRKIRWQRGMEVGLTFVALLATFALMPVATAAVAGAATQLGIAMTGSVAPMIAQMIGGVLAYNGIRMPLSRVGNKIFGLETETANDRIEKIMKDHGRGKTITREQVVGVFASGNRELGQLVEDTYGKPYDRLSVPEKQGISNRINDALHLDQMVDGINQGSINIAELAFAVQGQASGVAPKQVEPSALPPEGWTAAIREKWHDIAHFVAGSKPAAAPAVEYDNPTPAQSFVSRVEHMRRGPDLQR